MNDKKRKDWAKKVNGYKPKLQMDKIKRFVLWLAIGLIIGSVIAPLVHAVDSNTIDINVTKTYAQLNDSYHIINYILGIGIVFFFIALLFVEILSPKRNVQDED